MLSILGGAVLMLVIAMIVYRTASPGTWNTVLTAAFSAIGVFFCGLVHKGQASNLAEDVARAEKRRDFRDP